jgi:hypothetical protein
MLACLTTNSPADALTLSYAPPIKIALCPVKRRATRVSHLCKSGGTYGNSLRLVRPTDPCWRKLRAIRRTHRVGVTGRFPGICGSFLRLAPLTCFCFRRHVAIPRIGHLDHGRRLLGSRPGRPEQIGKRPMSELQKEPLPPRPRMQPCALLTSQLNAGRTPGFEELFTLTFCSKIRAPLGFLIEPRCESRRCRHPRRDVSFGRQPTHQWH